MKFPGDCNIKLLAPFLDIPVGDNALHYKPTQAKREAGKSCLDQLKYDIIPKLHCLPPKRRY